MSAELSLRLSASMHTVQVYLNRFGQIYFHEGAEDPPGKQVILRDERAICFVSN